MAKDKNEIKKYICYTISGVFFFIGIIQMIYGTAVKNESPWYDYFIELLFLSFIGIMILKLAKTFK